MGFEPVGYILCRFLLKKGIKNVRNGLEILKNKNGSFTFRWIGLNRLSWKWRLFREL